MHLPTPSSDASPDRTILVVESGFDHTVALHSRVDVHQALTRPVSPEHLEQAVADAPPFPFAIVGVTPPGAQPAPLSSGVLETVHAHPVLIWWKGSVPDGLPAHTRRPRSWSVLLDEVVAALHRRVGGMALAQRRGVVLDGNERVVQSPTLEGFIAGGDQEWVLDTSAAIEATRELAAAGISYTVGHVGGVARLEATACR